MEDTIPFVKQGRWLEIFLSSSNNFYLNCKDSGIITNIHIKILSLIQMKINFTHYLDEIIHDDISTQKSNKITTINYE